MRILMTYILVFDDIDADFEIFINSEIDSSATVHFLIIRYGRAGFLIS